MFKKIIFTNTTAYKELEFPQAASNFVPDWYKNTKSYINDQKKPNGSGGTDATIKRCMPVFDAITSGYIITSPADVYVKIKDGDQYFEWPSFGLIQFHPIEQAPEHPYKKPYAYPKWISPWGIKTPKGYSTLFIQPLHRESVFTILPGIVDTDKYNAPVNFPFVINNPSFEGLIPAGTPIAQVIPIKRNSWIKKSGNKHDIIGIEQTNIKLRLSFFDGYRNRFWKRKEYK
jgi:hypothetical protein